MIVKKFLVILILTFSTSLTHGSLVYSDDIFNPLEYKEFINLWSNVNVTDVQRVLKNGHPHANRNTSEIAELYGYASETHKIETSDGYILTLHRIMGNKTNPSPNGKVPILLGHGLFCSSIIWVMTGPDKSLGFLLADAGYDVWMGNFRGSRYSRDHKNKKISKKNYWNFSWHEMGVHDLTSMIDYILEKTSKKKLLYAGHSQGTTSFFVMASEKPEYNDKVEAMFALSPVAYSKHMISPLCKFLSKFVKNFKFITNLIGLYEVAPSSRLFGKFASTICSDHHISKVCMNFIFLIAGFNINQFDMELLPVIVSHLPAGASMYQLYHYLQLIQSGHFRQFDHGIFGNLKKYKWITPPAYEVEKITTPIYMHYSNNDWLSHPTDIKKLYSKLPNVHRLSCISDNKFNHLDFIWAKDVKTLLYQEVLDIMLIHKNSVS